MRGRLGQMADYDDLDDLLDDTALTESILSKPPGESTRETGKETKKPEKPQSALKDEPNQSTSGLESLLAEMEQKGDPDEALRSLLAQLNPGSEEVKEETDFEGTIAETMERLQKSQKPGTSDAGDVDALAQLLQGLQGDAEDGPGLGGLDGILGNLLNELASKDVLYEPLKELHTNYPAWLTENASKLSDDERVRFEKQKGIVEAVVLKFESPDYSDQNAAHREFIAAKMAEMEETGAPPAELAGDVTGGGIPGLGNPPDMPSECATQ